MGPYKEGVTKTERHGKFEDVQATVLESFKYIKRL